MVQLSQLYTTIGKTIALTRKNLLAKLCLCFLIFCLGWSYLFFQGASIFNFRLHSSSAVILHLPQNKVYHCFHCFPSICHEVMGPDAMILVLWMLSFKPTYSLSSFNFIKRLFSSFLLSAIRVVSPVYLRLLIFDICPGNLDSSLCFSQPLVKWFIGLPRWC